MEDLTPLYNKEFYLAYLCGEDVVLPIPDGNAERYLAYLCGMDVTIPDVPDGRTETYLAYKCGEDVVLPDPMYRIEYYLAKWCGIDCEVPEPMYRIEYWLAQLANSGELKTVTGNPISVSDALAKPAESLVVGIELVQSGSGDPSPDNVRPISGHDSVKVWVKPTYDPTANPTATIQLGQTVYGGTVDLVSGVLTVDRAIADLGDLNWTYNSGQLSMVSTDLNGVSGDGQNIYCSQYKKIASLQGVVLSAEDKCIAFNKASTVPTGNFAPGVLVVKDTSYTNASTFKTAMSGVQLVYELATPITIQLTPTEIEMLLGNNVIWNDVGDMVLEYLADGPADDIDALNILLNNRYMNNGEPDEATDREALDILLGGNTR